jgi:acyl-CoA thioesterase-1
VLACVAVGVPAEAADRLIVAFGDSLTAGYGLKPNESFPVQLESTLRRQGIPARVVNAGVSGDTSAGGKARLAWVLNALKAKPDLVIVELGANDMLRGLPVAQARANLDAILAELRRRKLKVLIAGMRSAPNMGRAYVQGFEGMYPSLAKTYGAGLYPFFLEGVTGQRGLTLPDGLHPTARGVAVIVRGIMPQVKAGLSAK